VGIADKRHPPAAHFLAAGTAASLGLPSGAGLRQPHPDYPALTCNYPLHHITSSGATVVRIAKHVAVLPHGM